MKKLMLFLVAIMIMTALIIPTSIAYAAEYSGWYEISEALLDGDGAEFIVDDSYPVFPGSTEFEKVIAAANWVAFHMGYENDPYPPGDVWTSSDQLCQEITPYVENSTYGDCEDFSIMLCALMRYSIGVPANRVWVQAGIVAVPMQSEKPPLVGHAYVVYKAERGGIFYIEPQFGGFPYRGAYPSLLHWYFKRPPQSGESATLRFNDEWVKGGGFYLAGLR
ncbi:MAG TPA: transglutaminase domain-containing protein [Dehalococcoidia bacterium]|nr:transglutaminase domain-containing protein [Dehalococcoidia bacterium]